MGSGVLKRIYDGEKRKAGEIPVAGNEPGDAVVK
jgi:hypothetical protein